MGGFSANRNYAQGHIAGGARPQTAEIMKTLGERCSESIVTIDKEKADYILILQHEGGKGFARKDNKFALFNKDGDAIKSGSTRSLGNAVKDTCKAMMEDWQQSAEVSHTQSADSSYSSTPPTPSRQPEGSRHSDTSNRSARGSVGDTMNEYFDKMVATAHPNDPPQQSVGKEGPQAQDTEPARNEPAAGPSPTQPLSPGISASRQATTEFGKLDSALMAVTLADHFDRIKAERTGDLEEYEKLKKQGKLRKVANHSQVQIINSAKDQEGGEVFEVKLANGKTAWIESKFIK
jgi:hypothetical protein